MMNFLLGLFIGTLFGFAAFAICSHDARRYGRRKEFDYSRIDRYSEPVETKKTRYAVHQVLADAALAYALDDNDNKDLGSPLVLIAGIGSPHYDNEVIEVEDPIIIGVYTYTSTIHAECSVQAIVSRKKYNAAKVIPKDAPVKHLRVTGLVSTLMLTTTLLTSCDEHYPLDLGIYPGFVLCDDHSSMTLETYKKQDKVNAVGVIYATATEEHPMLAVMLEEFDAEQFADTLSYSQGTSCDVKKFDGFTNTVSMQNSFDVKTGHGSPLGDAVFRFHQFGQSDYIPSVAEMRLLVSAIPTVNPVIAALGGTPISVDSKNGGCWYWTSTEVAENKSNQAWLVSAVNGAYQETPKDEYHPARAIVSLNY